MMYPFVFSADSSSVKMPSWLKPVSGSPELSFEERRHSYMFSRKREGGERRRRRSFKELQTMSLSERKLEILDSLLSSEQIQPIVIKLVSSDKSNEMLCNHEYIVHRLLFMFQSIPTATTLGGGGPHLAVSQAYFNR